MITTHTTLFILLLLALTAAVLCIIILWQSNRYLTEHVGLLEQKLRSAPVAWMAWKTDAPDRGGMWCLLNLPPGQMIPLVTVYELPAALTREHIERQLKGATLLMCLGPLPRLSEVVPAAVFKGEGAP